MPPLETVSVPVVESPGTMAGRVIRADAGLSPMVNVPTVNAFAPLVAVLVKIAKVYAPAPTLAMARAMVATRSSWRVRPGRTVADEVHGVSRRSGKGHGSDPEALGMVRAQDRIKPQRRACGPRDV